MHCGNTTIRIRKHAHVHTPHTHHTHMSYIAMSERWDKGLRWRGQGCLWWNSDWHGSSRVILLILCQLRGCSRTGGLWPRTKRRCKHTQTKLPVALQNSQPHIFIMTATRRGCSTTPLWGEIINFYGSIKSADNVCLCRTACSHCLEWWQGQLGGIMRPINSLTRPFLRQWQEKCEVVWETADPWHIFSAVSLVWLL